MSFTWKTDKAVQEGALARQTDAEHTATLVKSFPVGARVSCPTGQSEAHDNAGKIFISENSGLTGNVPCRRKLKLCKPERKNLQRYLDNRSTACRRQRHLDNRSTACRSKAILTTGQPPAGASGTYPDPATIRTQPNTRAEVLFMHCSVP